MAGVDEVGRGPLAGPVVAAAVVLDPVCVPNGIRDSKALAAGTRERLFDAICASADVGLAFASAATIDRVSIRQATFLAMRRAAAALACPPDFVLIDGRDVPPGLAQPATAIVAGDASCLSIAAASIVAKVVRDRMMARADGAFAAYGLARHKGYGTEGHRTALRRHGPCRLHRLTFAPVAGAADREA